MLEVVCPRCHRSHHADEVHIGRLLKCAGCGDAVQIENAHQTHPDKPLPEIIGSQMPAKPVKRKKAPQFRRPYLRSKIKVLVSIALLVAGLLVFRTWHKFVTEEAQLDAEVAAKSHHYAQPHVAPAAVEEQSRSLSTGTRLQPDVFTDGHGVLTVENYSGEDAVLKVVVSSTKRPIRKVFIQRNSRVDIHGIEEGAYRILFTMGEDWDDSTEQFTREESYYEFGKILFFEETRESDGIRYSTHEITLNTTIGGNVPRVEISRQEFLAE